MPRQPRQGNGNRCHGRAWSIQAFTHQLQAVEHQRHPGECVNLVEVRDVTHHQAAETADKPAERARERGAGQPPDEQKRGGAGQRVRGDEEDVPVDVERAEQTQYRIPRQRLRVGRDGIARPHPFRPERRRRKVGGDAEVERVAWCDVVPAQETLNEENGVEETKQQQRRQERAGLTTCRGDFVGYGIHEDRRRDRGGAQDAGRDNRSQWHQRA